MSFTYHPETLLDSSDEYYDLHRLRFILGDTVETGHEFEDEELSLLLQLEVTPEAAALVALRTRIAKYAGHVDKWVGDLKILASQKVKHYTDLLAEMTGTDAFVGTPSAGGVYVAEKEAAALNTSLVQPFFSRGMDDNLEG
jgi:hypothetical protein